MKFGLSVDISEALSCPKFNFALQHLNFLHNDKKMTTKENDHICLNTYLP